MPLPHFLLLILTVVLAAAATLWASFAAGIPLMTLMLIVLTGVVLVHYSSKNRHDQDG